MDCWEAPWADASLSPSAFCGPLCDRLLGLRNDTRGSRVERSLSPTTVLLLLTSVAALSRLPALPGLP